SLAQFYQRKRDLFLECLSGSRFSWTPAAGSYFQLLDFSAIAETSDVEFAERVLSDARVASIPITPFYADPPPIRTLRFCFAKNDATLEQAAERLCAL